MSNDRRNLSAAAWVVLNGSAVEDLADRLAPLVASRLRPAPQANTGRDRWLGAKEAARYLGISVNALHKLTAARSIPFEQDGPGCKLWFKADDLDAWRRGR